MLGIAGGTPFVMGGSQIGKTLVTDGWPNSVTVLKAGDLFQVENSLYMNLTDASSNGSGQATLDIWPTARTPADNAPLVVSAPKNLWRLSKGFSWKENEDHLFEIDFSGQEAR